MTTARDLGDIVLLTETVFMNDDAAVSNATVDELSPALTVALAFEALALFFLTLTGVLGNLLVIVAILKDRRLKKLNNLFLVSLAIADLLVSMFIMSAASTSEILGMWPFGYVACKIWLAGDITCSTCSILNLCAISLDRYIHIKAPMHYEQMMTKSKVFLILTVVWVVSLLLSTIPITLGWHERDENLTMKATWAANDDPVCTLRINSIYAIVSSSISFFLPCVAMITVYVKIYFIASSHVKVMSKDVQTPILTPSGGGSRRSRTKFKLSDYKALVTLGIIMGVFILCWLPFFIGNVVVAVCESCVSEIVMVVFNWLGYTNSVANVFIYTIFNVEFRKAFRRTLLRYVCCRTVDDRERPDYLVRSAYHDNPTSTAMPAGAGVSPYTHRAVLVNRSRISDGNSAAATRNQRSSPRAELSHNLTFTSLPPDCHASDRSLSYCRNGNITDAVLANDYANTKLSPMPKRKTVETNL